MELNRFNRRGQNMIREKNKKREGIHGEKEREKE